MRTPDEQLLGAESYQKIINEIGPGSRFFPPNGAPDHKRCKGPHQAPRHYHMWADRQGLVWGCNPSR